MFFHSIHLLSYPHAFVHDSMTKKNQRLTQFILFFVFTLEQKYVLRIPPINREHLNIHQHTIVARK